MRNGDDSRVKESEKDDYLKNIRDTFRYLRDKALFLAKLSSGLDDVDLFELKTDDFNKGMNEFDVCYLHGRRKKNGMHYQTFFNSEAVNMIELYLKEREHKDSDSWLFANIKDDTKKCSFNTFSEAIKIVCRKLEIKNITPKSLRRIFNTKLKRGKIDSEYRESLLGHKLDTAKGTAYDLDLSDEYNYAEIYAEKVEHLTLLGNGNRKLTNVEKELDELKIRNKGLEQTLDEFKSDALKMKRLLLELFVKTEGYDTLGDLEREEGKLENQEYTLSIVSEDDNINEALRKQKNDNLQYLAQIKKDLE